MSYKCRILAIDGGGIRGVIPAFILQSLEKALGKPVYECFDIIGGTSTGGLIALALTTPQIVDGNLTVPWTAANVLGLYMNDDSDLFVAQSYIDDSAFYAKYYSTAPWMTTVLSPTMTLSQARQNLQQVASDNASIPAQVFTTCYTLSPGTSPSPVMPGPYLFNWVDAAADPNGPDDYYVWEAALGTSSAPTYFPLAAVGSGMSNSNTSSGDSVNGSTAAARWVADGGLVSNNPALHALAWASKLGLYSDLSDVLVVSLGTGMYNGGVAVPSDDTGNWGTSQWSTGYDETEMIYDMNGNSTLPLLSALGMGNEQVPDMQLQLILPSGNYFRLEPTLPYSETPLDGTDVNDLLTTATDYLQSGAPGYALFQGVCAALS